VNQQRCSGTLVAPASRAAAGQAGHDGVVHHPRNSLTGAWSALAAGDEPADIRSRNPKLPTRADAELGDHLAHIPFGRAGADEELRANDNRVGFEIFGSVVASIGLSLAYEAWPTRRFLVATLLAAPASAGPRTWPPAWRAASRLMLRAARQAGGSGRRLAGVGRPGMIGVQVADAVAGHSVAPVLPGVARHLPAGPEGVPSTPVSTVDDPSGHQHQRHQQPNAQPEDQQPHRDLPWPTPNSPSVAALVGSGQTDLPDDAVTQGGTKPRRPQRGPSRRPAVAWAPPGSR
jgi:hypothetical protein